MDLTVVIPTRNRRAVLCEALTRLDEQTGDVAFEVLVVDDGSDDGTPEAVRGLHARTSLDLTLIEQAGRGPAAARNRALAVARAPVCLFMNDDSWARRDLLARHRDFHARHPHPAAALLGSIVLPADPPPTPFMRWLAGVRFGYAGIQDRASVGGERFFTANVSAKTELLRGVGGFDEAFPDAAQEDIELGLRLQAQGMRLAYDPDAIVEHFHPLDLAGTLDSLRRAGRSLAPLVERHPDFPVPRRPGLRHRTKAGALTVLTTLHVRMPALQRETWRFLCHEASREGYWSAVDGDAANGRLRIGRQLARRAARDVDTQLPADSMDSMARR